MRFWDSSAVMPLVADEPRSKAQAQRLRDDAEIAVWWATRVEVVSAVRRLEREGLELGDALRAVAGLAARWHEVAPSENIRTTAERLLAVHPLRAADALQLAAAIAWRRDITRPATFVCLDARLRDAAAREGLDLEPEALG